MKTVVLVGCGKAKLDHAAPARDLYTGALFRKARAWAEREGDEWGILSAKHGLLMPDEIVEPYDLSLDRLAPDDYRQWRGRARWQIVSRWPGRRWEDERGYVRLDGERFICLASALYGGAFGKPGELVVEYPLAGLGIGKRLRFLGQGSGEARDDSRSAESVPGGTLAAPRVQVQGSRF